MTCINVILSIYVCKCKSCALHTRSRYSDILSGDQHWVPVKDVEICHGLCSPGLGFCFPIVCSARVKAYFKRGNGKAPTDCKEREVWPSVSNKSSVKGGGGSSLGLLRGWWAASALSHPPCTPLPDLQGSVETPPHHTAWYTQSQMNLESL